MSDNEQENENRETVADIVAQMRYGTIPKHRTDHELVATYANRIDAACKRERAEAEAEALAVGGIVEAARTAEKSSAVGNAAAMRDALRYIIRQIDKNPERLSSGQLLCIIGDKAESALSAPARNCDLNLSEKSLFYKFEDYMHDCGLPFYSEPSGEDAFDWLLAQA